MNPVSPESLEARTGHFSCLAEFPDERLTIIVLSNQDHEVGPVVAKIARAALADTTQAAAR